MTRGGPRPGFGGKQPGAGRPAGPVTDKPVAVVLDPETARHLDAARGIVSRAEWVRRLINAPITGERRMAVIKLVVVAGDSGVYVGYAEGGSVALVDGRVVLRGARHLRRYYVAGHSGDGSAGDLAVRGLAPDSPSISEPVPGNTVLLGIRRAFDVTASAAPTFGCPND